MRPIKIGLSYNDVLLIPQFSDIRSRSEVDLSTKIAPDISLKIPLLSINMDTVTGVEMAIEMYKLGGLGLLPRFDKPEIQAEKVEKIVKAGAKVAASIGIKDDNFLRSEILLKVGATALTIDIAHAHTASTLEFISKFKQRFPKVSLIAGTIATYQGAYDLFKAGSDTVRVGVGVGTICTTRIVAGSGVPQITAILDAVKAKKKFKNRFVLGDGGAANSGDIVKALACGASAVISGSLYAGCDEAPGKLIEENGEVYKEYNGSTSKTEKIKQINMDSNGKSKHYTIHVEGVEAMVKYKGPVKDIVTELCAGIKSGLSYSGAKNIKEFWRNAQFIQITAAGYRESQAHDVLPRQVEIEKNDKPQLDKNLFYSVS
ncbi:MAG: inosine-5'-monophosphate dehydrogenase, IMP dehydrogenase [Microgenomates group bacterium GW2011_GWC1_38_14]|nr:MAG: inosine-5'-monophosphate dehydrogenase, IMP dehydrogenase [Microgenomates group bacterium GW2011_GWC1_38_14]OGH43594.1 MAG: hypothetical protein A3I49_00375 [Candidatus Levybacteria bacterium RIFCSPLOWO2_02_FULL_37_11]